MIVDANPHIFNISSKICKSLTAGIITIDNCVNSLIEHVVYNDLNKRPDCEGVPFKFTSTICETQVDFSEEYTFEVGLTAPDMEIWYGWYDLSIGSSLYPGAIEIENDIVNVSPGNYDIYSLAANEVSLTITGTNASFHVFSVPIDFTPVIEDATGLNITSAFKLVSDTQRKYYFLDNTTPSNPIPLAIAPFPVTYKIKK